MRPGIIEIIIPMTNAGIWIRLFHPMELMQNINSMIMMKFGMRALHQPLKNPYLRFLMWEITPTTKMGIYGLQVPNPGY